MFSETGHDKPDQLIDQDDSQIIQFKNKHCDVQKSPTKLKLQEQNNMSDNERTDMADDLHLQGATCMEDKDENTITQDTVDCFVNSEDDDLDEQEYRTPKRGQKNVSLGNKSNRKKRGTLQLWRTNAKLPPPIFNTRPPPLANDQIYFSELSKVQQEAQDIDKQIEVEQREAKLFQEQIAAEEKWKKLIQLRQQRQRYEKKINKANKHDKKRDNQHELEGWLQNQLNSTLSQGSDGSIGSSSKLVPIGIPVKKSDRINLIAEELANDDNLSICRDTGIMRRRDSPGRHRDRSPKSTSTRSERSRSSRVSTASRHKDKGRSRDRERSTLRDRTSRGGNYKKNRYHREEPWSREMNRALSSSSNYHDSGESETSSNNNSSSDKTYAGTKKQITRKKNSGINAKPYSQVKQELVYPHYSLAQHPSFIGIPLNFHNLSYEQFLAGELTTIMNSTSNEERQGRVTLLHKIAAWKLMSNTTWPQVRNTYAHVVRRIENKEISWSSNFDKFERHIYEKISSKNDKMDKKKISIKSDWFCKQFQRSEGCSKETPHMAIVNGQNRQVSHFCAACWQKDRRKKWHSESSPECPLKEL